MSQATVSEHEGAEYEQYGGEFSLDRISGFSVCRRGNRKGSRFATNIKNKQVKKEKAGKSGILTWSTAIKRWWTQESKLSWSPWSRSSSSKDVDDKSISALSTDWKEVFAKSFNELCDQCSKNCEVSLGRKSHLFMLAAKAKKKADEKGKVIGKSAHLNFIQAIRNALPFAGSVEKYMEILLVPDAKKNQSQMQFNESKTETRESAPECRVWECWRFRK